MFVPRAPLLFHWWVCVLVCALAHRVCDCCHTQADTVLLFSLMSTAVADQTPKCDN